jgi:acetoin utilization protein AcuB
MKLSTLIDGRDPVTLYDDDNVALAVHTMLLADIRHIPILRDGNLVGVVTERDLLAHKARRGKPGLGDLLSTVMTKPVVTARPDMDVAEAADLMLSGRLGCLPVVDGRAIVGVVTRSDVIAAWRETAGEPRPDRRTLLRGLMKRAPLTASAGELLLDAVGRMELNGVRHLPVVDGEGHLVGMLSDRDVRTAIGNALRPLGPRDAVVRLESTHVADVMSRRPVAVDEEATLAEAAALLALRRVGALAVVDANHRLSGIVSYVDVLRAYAEGSS